MYDYLEECFYSQNVLKWNHQYHSEHKTENAMASRKRVLRKRMIFKGHCFRGHNQASVKYVENTNSSAAKTCDE